jgi:hypothetical protein
VGVVALASSDVLPGRATQKSGVTFYNHCGNKHHGDAHKSEKNRVGKEENEYRQAGNETSDTPAHTSATVRVNIGLSNILRETGILLRQGLFQFGQDSLLVL